MGKLVDTDELIINIANIEDLRKLSTKTIGEAIDKTPAVNEWVSIQDRLPEKSQYYLVRYKHTYAEDDFRKTGMAFYVDELEAFFEIDSRFYAITHWMKLPEPPKGE